MKNKKMTSSRKINSGKLPLHLKSIATLLSMLSLLFIGFSLPLKTVGQNGAGKASANKIPVDNVAPPAPVGCVATLRSFSNQTPVAIIDNAAVTSTINVNTINAFSYLWDIDLLTSVTHTFSSDIDMTIQSPAGTVVTLTTDNATSLDNVFNGTLWDDDADDPVTDHLFTNLVTATPLVPEEAMGAFIGENPSGIWTITIFDDTTGDTGSLDNWRIDLTTFPLGPFAAATTNFTNTTPVPITVGTPAVSTINVSGATGSITKTTLQSFITHTFAADIDMTIQSPAGTIVTLTTDNGSAFDDVFNGTLFDDDADPGSQVPYTANVFSVTDHTYTDLMTATPLVPEEAMAAFAGENANGIWTLTVVDDAGGDEGSLNQWNLNITSGGCPTAANVGVSGKVVSQSGIGIYRAAVNMTDAQGNVVTRITNPFGYFEFADVGAGQTYTVSVASKGYDFSPQVLTIDDTISNLTLVAKQ